MVKLVIPVGVAATILATTSSAESKPGRVQVDEWTLPDNVQTECREALPAKGVVHETYEEFLKNLTAGLASCDPDLGPLSFNLRYVWTEDQLQAGYIPTCPADLAHAGALELQWFFGDPAYKLESMFAIKVTGNCDQTMLPQVLNLSDEKCDAGPDRAGQVPLVAMPAAGGTGFIPSPAIAGATGSSATIDLQACDQLTELSISTYNVAYGTAGVERTTDASENTTDASENTTDASENTTDASEHTTHASEHTTHASEHTTHASEHTTDASEEPTDGSDGSSTAPPTPPPQSSSTQQDPANDTTAKAVEPRFAAVTGSLGLAVAMVVGRAF